MANDTAGRIENCQVAVVLTYAARGGHAVVDRACICPSPGAPTRTAASCGRPDDIAVAAKAASAAQLIESALMAGLRPDGSQATRSTAPTPACGSRAVPSRDGADLAGTADDRDPPGVGRPHSGVLIA